MPPFVSYAGFYLTIEKNTRLLRMKVLKYVRTGNIGPMQPHCPSLIGYSVTADSKGSNVNDRLASACLH